MKTCYYNYHKNKKLYELFESSRKVFMEYANMFLSLYDIYDEIPSTGIYESNDYYFNNGWFPPLDAISVGIILNKFRDIESVIEIGSGNSTKLFKLLRTKLNLNFKLTSIDPAPRANIINSTDEHIKAALEDTDIKLLIRKINSKKTLLFIDSSHKVLPSSDCAIIISELMNNLNSGTLLHFHDIFLPKDYPDSWKVRGYNEQYFIANYLLNSKNYDLLWGSSFIGTYMVVDVFNKFHKSRPDLNLKAGGSLWLKM